MARFCAFAFSNRGAEQNRVMVGKFAVYSSNQGCDLERETALGEEIGQADPLPAQPTRSIECEPGGAVLDSR